MGMQNNKNVGAGIKIAGQSILAVAGGAALAVNGATIDRVPAGSTQRFDSAVIAASVSEDTALAGGQTATLSTVLEESVDGTTWTVVADETVPDVVLTEGGIVSDVLDHDVNMSGLQRFVRAVSTLTLSAGPGTGVFGGMVVLGGAAIEPV